MLTCFNTQIKKQGFTLIELLVVISIILIISGVVLINYRPGQEQLALQRAASKLASDIRRAQAMAMEAREFQGTVPPGYGVILDRDWNTQEYRLYADTNGENEFFNPPDSIVETIDLESGVVIKEICLSLVCTYSSVSINFKPPDPKVNIRFNTGSSGPETIITLSLTADPSRTKTITVNEAGRIEVD